MACVDAAEERPKWRLVIIAGLVAFIAMFMMNTVNVALPEIERSFDVSPRIAQWVILGYAIPVIAFLLPGGRWLDETGKRSAFGVTVGCFGLTSAAAAVAPGVGSLIAARAAQGVSGAVLLSLAPALVALATRPGSRGTAMGVVLLFGSIGAVVGPGAGGFLLQAFGWRAVFFLMAPVCLLVIVSGLRVIPRDGRFRRPDARWAAEAILPAAAIVAVALALSLADTDGAGWLALALPAVPLLLAWRRLPGTAPVLSLMRLPGLARAHVAVLMLAFSNGAVLFLIPFYLVRTLEVSPGTLGITVLALPAAVAVIGPIGGALADRWGYRGPATAGAVLTAAGMVLLFPLPDDWGPADVVWRLVVLGAGIGMYGGPIQAVVMDIVPRQRFGTAGATLQLARNLGFTLGPALTTTAWTWSGGDRSEMWTGLVPGTVTAVIAVLVLAVGNPAGARSPEAARAGAPG
jgi:DHA2 family multidrug resistance protein-like MFS transporter